MKMYLLKLVFHIQRNTSGIEEEFEEQYWNVLAPDLDNALEAGRELGKGEEEELDTFKGEKLMWKFIGITEAIELEQEHFPRLLFTSTARANPDENYTDFVNTKATFLTLKNPTFV